MKHLAGLASAMGALLVAVLVTLTAAAVFMRYVVGAPISWTEEVSAILMIWIIMLGAISCEWHRQHLTIDFAVAWLPRPGRRLLAVAVALLSVAVLLTMAWLGWGLAQASGFKRTQILGISWFWMNLAVVVGASGAAAVTLWQLAFPPRDPLTADAKDHRL